MDLASLWEAVLDSVCCPPGQVLWLGYQILGELNCSQWLGSMHGMLQWSTRVQTAWVELPSEGLI